MTKAKNGWLAEPLLYFLRLGTLGFAGPVALILHSCARGGPSLAAPHPRSPVVEGTRRVY
jgi:hypothetical protein